MILMLITSSGLSILMLLMLLVFRLSIFLLFSLRSTLLICALHPLLALVEHHLSSWQLAVVCVDISFESSIRNIILIGIHFMTFFKMLVGLIFLTFLLRIVPQNFLLRLKPALMILYLLGNTRWNHNLLGSNQSAINYMNHFFELYTWQFWTQQTPLCVCS